jgi:hypothetical protein
MNGHVQALVGDGRGGFVLEGLRGLGAMLPLQAFIFPSAAF